jgi:predicted enzyme related to lactoylglutathione lyase
VYLLAEAHHAGRGVMALVVDDLDATLTEITARGIVIGAIEEIPGAARKCVIRDPDGNAISILQILTAPDGESGEPTRSEPSGEVAP